VVRQVNGGWRLSGRERGRTPHARTASGAPAFPDDGKITPHFSLREKWGTRLRLPSPEIYLLRFGEAHGYGVHAVSEAGGLGAVIEDVAEVGFAATAGYFGAGHAEGSVGGLNNIFFGDGLVEAGPAGAGIEFGGGVEESGVAADAAENSLGVIVGIFVGVGTLGAFVTRDFVGVGGKLFAPFGVGLDDGGDGDFFCADTGVGKFYDVDGFRNWKRGGFGGGGVLFRKKPECDARAADGGES
jgi:hypothetical protein